MGGGGSIQGMINSLKNNKKLLRRNRMFLKDRSFLNLKKEYLKAADGEVNFKKATKKQLSEIRVKVIRERKKRSYIYIGLFIACFFIIGFPIYHDFKANKMAEETTDSIQLEKDKKEYLDLIADGDLWLSKKKWHNAIFQYKEALTLFPKEYDANYRLAMAYCYRCESEFEDCKKAKKLLEKLIRRYPNRLDLLKLKKILEFEY